MSAVRLQNATHQEDFNKKRIIRPFVLSFYCPFPFIKQIAFIRRKKEIIFILTTSFQLKPQHLKMYKRTNKTQLNMPLNQQLKYYGGILWYVAARAIGTGM